MIPAGIPLLEAVGVGVEVDGRTLCRTLDLTVQRGERVAILGRNGAGKSTLLSVLAGLRVPDRGEVLLGGVPYRAQTARQAARRRGYLPQVQHDAFASSVLETAMTGRHPHLDRLAWESDDDAEFARTALNYVGLTGMDERNVQSLSGGERQRLAVATLLTQEPNLYLLDEPLAHLDMNHAIAVLEILSSCARQGAGVVMVLHEPGLAARYCDRVVLLAPEGAVKVGSVAELLTSDALSALYGLPLRTIDDRGRPWFVPE